MRDTRWKRRTKAERRAYATVYSIPQFINERVQHRPIRQDGKREWLRRKAERASSGIDAYARYRWMVQRISHDAVYGHAT